MHRLLAALLLAACAPAAAPPAAGDAPVPSTMPTPPTAPVTDLYTSSDGLVAAPRPPGDGWECVENASRAPGQEATLIKCRRTDRARFFFLMAKDYAVPADQVRSPEVLSTRVFPATYRSLFTSHEIRESNHVEHAGRDAHEILMDAEHAGMGKIRKRERVITHGNHVFVLSAEGKPEVFDAESAAISAWFSGARFKNMP
jgi:hypothetical protein